MIHIGNAPCSWGTLEFDQMQAGKTPLTPQRYLDELAESGYTGTELGDWGFLPTDARALSQELQRRKLSMTGAFVPLALKLPLAHAVGEQHATHVARLLADVASDTTRPYVVLADENGSVPERVEHAGRIRSPHALSAAEWRTFADGVNRIAYSVKMQTGLPLVFHHHCGGYVETHEEIATLMSLTDPALVGLVFDTGHYAYANRSDGSRAGRDILRAMDAYAERIWYVHFKDFDPQVASKARTERWDYFKAIEKGVFCELGQGCVPFGDIIVWLQNRHYSGYVTVEQDVLPGMGTPKESARRNREYLKVLGI
jgi:inosose dehydratase